MKLAAIACRAFNQSGQKARCNAAVEEFKKGRGRKGAAPTDDLVPLGTQSSCL